MGCLPNLGAALDQNIDDYIYFQSFAAAIAEKNQWQ